MREARYDKAWQGNIVQKKLIGSKEEAEEEVAANNINFSRYREKNLLC
jgi:hypothetical protein